MAFQSKLLRWFSKKARPLPWRKHYNPYQVWISEIMLQQTQMDTVLPYYDRWMRTFPDITTLAQADESQVLKHWEGLGYYSRARNILTTAREIIQRFEGKFPSNYQAILSLKGIGRYSAGAICSIAFNQPKPIVDGNVLRVLSRVYAIKESIDIVQNREKYWDLQFKLIPPGKAREFNQALMELGALVCAPRNPACFQCPLTKNCQAFRLGEPEAFPVRSKKRKVVRVTALACAIHKSGSYLLLKRPLGKIMGGLWEFPEWKLTKESPTGKSASKLSAQHLGLALNAVIKVGVIKRNYTHHLETMHLFTGSCQKQTIRKEKGWKSTWATPSEFKNYPFSSAHAKVVALLHKA